MKAHASESLDEPTQADSIETCDEGWGTLSCAQQVPASGAQLAASNSPRSCNRCRLGQFNLRELTPNPEVDYPDRSRYYDVMDRHLRRQVNFVRGPIPRASSDTFA